MGEALGLIKALTEGGVMDERRCLHKEAWRWETGGGYERSGGGWGGGGWDGGGLDGEVGNPGDDFWRFNNNL